MTQTIRVYDPRGDFTLEVPDDARMTFGYFNPASPTFDGERGHTNQFGAPNVSRQTALRIYQGAITKKNQVAVFLGVSGYRYESLKLTKLEEAVTIVRSYSDDPESGVAESSYRREQVMKAIPERGVYF